MLPTPLHRPLLQILVISDGPDNVRDVEHALDKYCLDAPQLGTAQINFEVVAWADASSRILRGDKMDALLLDERWSDDELTMVTFCLHPLVKAKSQDWLLHVPLVRQYEVDHNFSQMPIIGISNTVKRADLEKYAMSGYSAIWGNAISERTAGKPICDFLTTYKAPSSKRRAQLKRGDIAEVKESFNGFMTFV
eukprot:SM000331S12520  [mRNA]  locus=s331:39469:40916:+ [translate_table: standard]